MLKSDTFISTPTMRSCSRLSRVLLSLAVLSLCVARPLAADDPKPLDKPPIQRGASLGLFSENPDWSYVDMIDEMKVAGISHVAIVVPYYMKTVRSVEIYRHPRYSMPMHTVERTIKDVRDRGMEVFLFPILRVEDGGWRGALKPADVDAFYRNYTTFILMWAELAAKHNIPIMSVGSELSSLDVDTPRWKAVIAAVRAVYKGQLTYSANWDHYKEVKFFDALDFAGVTGYFELQDKAREPDKAPDMERLIHSWRETYFDLMRWQHRVKKPLLFTEVGYLSQKGAAARPWDEGATKPIDLELQRMCYEAFARVWDGEDRLVGNYFWNWFGWGGADSNEYTPRNKPAAKEVQKWYGAAIKTESP